MSARLLLHSLLCSGREEDCALLDKAHEAVRHEVLREAAEKIRAKAHDLYGDEKRWASEAYGLLDAADLIDPDKEGSADGAEADRA